MNKFINLYICRLIKEYAKENVMEAFLVVMLIQIMKMRFQLTLQALSPHGNGLITMGEFEDVLRKKTEEELEEEEIYLVK